MQKGPPTCKNEIQAFLVSKKNVQRLKSGKMTGLFREKFVWIFRLFFSFFFLVGCFFSKNSPEKQDVYSSCPLQYYILCKIVKC